MPQFSRRPDAGGRRCPLRGLRWEEFHRGGDPARAYLDRGIVGEASRSVPYGHFPFSVTENTHREGCCGLELGIVGEPEWRAWE